MDVRRQVGGAVIGALFAGATVVFPLAFPDLEAASYRHIFNALCWGAALSFLVAFTPSSWIRAVATSETMMKLVGKPEDWRLPPRPQAEPHLSLSDEEALNAGRYARADRIPGSATPRLPEAEIMLRVNAITEMYDVLNTLGAEVHAEGSQFALEIRDHPRRFGPRATQDGLRSLRNRMTDLMRAITAVRQRHSIHENVFPQTLAEFGFTDLLWKARDELSGGVGLIERIEVQIGSDETRKIMADLVLLIEPRILPFQKAYNALGEWLRDHKAQLQAIRENLLRAI